jgi:PPE-repeat protein
MLDFGALPPEINSARMSSGPGSGPLMAAATAWDALAAQLDSYAASYSSTLSDLQGLWSGDASFAMTTAVAPYVAWATTTAAQAGQTAGQARAAAAAFEAAFAATVPPSAVAANRVELAVLVATNFFGQNTPAIAATEAQYVEMWAQDAAAMYAYAACSATATVLTPFTQPPQTTSAAGQSAQAAAVSQATGIGTGGAKSTLAELVPALLRQLPIPAAGVAAGPSAAALLPGTAYSTILTAFSDVDTFLVGLAQPFWSTTYAVFSAAQFGTGSRLLGLQLAKQAAKAIAPAAGAVSSEGVRGPVLARVGAATSPGKFSVPSSWEAASVPAGPANGPTAPPNTNFQVVSATNAQPGTNMVSAMPKEQSKSPTSFVLRNGRRRFQMPRPPYGG